MRLRQAIPAHVLELFSARHGVATRRELIAAGIPARRVDHWVETGAFAIVRRGTYRPVLAPETAALRVHAGVLRCGPDAVAGPYESLALIGIEGFRLGARCDAAVPAPRQVTGDTAARSLELLPGDTTVSRGIPALRVERALIAIMPLLPEGRRWPTIDSAVHRGHSTKQRLRECREVRRNLPGARLILTMLDSEAAENDSNGERRFDLLMKGIKPEPQRQVTTLVPGRRLDFAWPHLRYGLEYLGAKEHTAVGRPVDDGMRILQVFEHGVEVQQIIHAMVRDRGSELRRAIERALDRRARNVPALEAAGVLRPLTTAVQHRPPPPCAE